MINRIKKHSGLSLASVICICLGIFFLCAEASLLKSIVFIIIGLLLVLLSVTKMITLKEQLSKNDTLFTIITIAIGVTLIFFGTIVDWLFIFCGVLIILEPIVNIVKSTDRSSRLSLELPKIILGLILILLAFDAIYAIIFSLVGIVSLIIGIYTLYCVFNDRELIVVLNKNAFKKEKREDDIIDVE